MDPMVALIVLEIVLPILFFGGLWLLWRRVRAHFGGARGGWSGLVAAFGVAEPPKAPIATRATIVVGRVLWRNCVDVGVSPAGLHLAVRVPIFGASGRSPLLVPWAAFHGPEPAMLYWREANLWRLGTPEVGTLTLPRDLEAKIRAAGGLPGR